jgi:hypothetical protein
MGIFSFLKTAISDSYTDKRGYIRFKDGAKLVHRVVAEQKLGRRLRPGEVVHHKDRDKTNNDPDNLWVYKSQADHNRAHKQDAKRHGKKASYKGFKKKNGFWDFFT